MIRKLLALSAIAVCLMGATEQGITGKWKTIDDVTGYPKSIIEITETPSHQLTATIREVFPIPGIPAHDTCIACKGEKHNQPILGMNILAGMKADPGIKGRFIDGEILDPHNGKSYHCVLQLTDNGQKLDVRGYIGLPLFGRTQTWERV